MRIFPLPLSKHLNYGHSASPWGPGVLGSWCPGGIADMTTYVFNPPALAKLFAAVGHHVASGRRMVVNAIGARWIIVIGRPLSADGMQFFLCNHAHVGPIAALQAGTVVAVAGFSVGAGKKAPTALYLHCWLLLYLPVAVVDQQRLPLTCIDKRQCPDSSPRAVLCRRTAMMSCTHCDCNDAARNASALAAAMMSRLDPPGSCPVLCGRYSAHVCGEMGEVQKQETKNKKLHCCCVRKM